MSCYIINLKQLRNCGLSLNDKQQYGTDDECFMGGPFDVIRVYRSNKEDISMWKMLDIVCYNYSTNNAWTATGYLSERRIFNDIKTPLLTNEYYVRIEPTILKLRENEKINNTDDE